MPADPSLFSDFRLQLGGQPNHGLLVGLADHPVVCQKTVDFVLNIAQLCADAAAKSFFYGGQYFVSV